MLEGSIRVIEENNHHESYLAGRSVNCKRTIGLKENMPSGKTVAEILSE